MVVHGPKEVNSRQKELHALLEASKESQPLKPL